MIVIIQSHGSAIQAQGLIDEKSQITARSIYNEKYKYKLASITFTSATPNDLEAAQAVVAFTALFKRHLDNMLTIIVDKIYSSQLSS